ncbi:MAG: UvrABC system protein C [Prosthecobacter sp.]|nr:UvrABC system protein C [Prosthecobacter sp.]
MSEEVTRAATSRQLKLFHLENPLTLRFGNDFFRSLPEGPGVYFFHGSEGQLLYIGQSSNLRARLGSYRHVGEGRHPRRTLRLVARVVRIEWQPCASAAEAIETERLLLWEHRPPFNRAGVWKGDPWWLVMEVEASHLTLRLLREATPGSLGPLPPTSRHHLSALVRALLRLAHPDWQLADFPRGLMASALPRECRFQVPCPTTFVENLTTALAGDLPHLLSRLETLLPAPTATEQTFWQEERETLAKLRR